MVSVYRIGFHFQDSKHRICDILVYYPALMDLGSAYPPHGVQAQLRAQKPYTNEPWQTRHWNDVGTISKGKNQYRFNIVSTSLPLEFLTDYLCANACRKKYRNDIEMIIKTTSKRFQEGKIDVFSISCWHCFRRHFSLGIAFICSCRA